VKLVDDYSWSTRYTSIFEGEVPCVGAVHSRGA
jgi:hypothetical protein